MQPDVMRVRGSVVNSAAQMLSSGDVNLDTMPHLIVRIISEGMWCQRAIPQRRWELSREFGSFEEFVTTDPLDGLGTSVPILKDLCRRLPEAVDAIDEACRHDQGGDRRSESFKGNNVTLETKPAGNTQAKALRRLRKDRPDLHVRVLAGELSAHAAAVEAGFRPRTFTVRADNTNSAAATLRKHMPRESLLRLAELLTKED